MCSICTDEEGHSFTLAFSTPLAAAQFSIQAQRQLLEAPWPQELLDSTTGRPITLVTPAGKGLLDLDQGGAGGGSFEPDSQGNYPQYYSFPSRVKSEGSSEAQSTQPSSVYTAEAAAAAAGSAGDLVGSMADRWRRLGLCWGTTSKLSLLPRVIPNSKVSGLLSWGLPSRTALLSSHLNRAAAPSRNTLITLLDKVRG